MTEQTPQTLEARIITRALQDPSFKQQLLNGSVAAKAAIEQEIGQKLPQDLQVKVLEETDNVSYIVLPMMSSPEEISEEELEAVSGGATPAVAGRALLAGGTLPCTLGSFTINLTF